MNNKAGFVQPRS